MSPRVYAPVGSRYTPKAGEGPWCVGPVPPVTVVAAAGGGYHVVVGDAHIVRADTETEAEHHARVFRAAQTDVRGDDSCQDVYDAA